MGVTKVHDPAIVVVVVGVDDSDDDELVSVLARASRVPAAHLRASWAFELTAGQVRLTLPTLAVLVLALPALYIGARALVFGAPESWTSGRTRRRSAV